MERKKKSLDDISRQGVRIENKILHRTDIYRRLEDALDRGEDISDYKDEDESLESATKYWLFNSHDLSENDKKMKDRLNRAYRAEVNYKGNISQKLGFSRFRYLDTISMADARRVKIPRNVYMGNVGG